MPLSEDTSATSVHRLEHQQAGKTCVLTLADSLVSTETGQAGKTRRTEKRLADAAEAAKYVERQEWTLLKKGFVLHDPAAAPGQPRLHCYIGGGYTGSLALATTPAGMFVYRHGWFTSATDQQDFLVQLDAAGQVRASIELPTILAWDMHYQPAWHALVLDLDHSVYAYDLASGHFQPLSAPGTGAGSAPVSFVAAAAGRTAYAAGNELVVLDADRQELVRLPFETEMRNGSVPFAAALAGNGQVVALHHTAGVVELRSARDGSLQHTITGIAGPIRQLAFAGDDQLLLLLELPGSGLRCFDLAQGRETALPWQGGEDWPAVQACCLSADQSRVALQRGSWVEVFDGASWQLQRRFRLAHCVRTAKLQFMDDALGVRTDYGCFSLYHV